MAASNRNITTTSRKNTLFGEYIPHEGIGSLKPLTRGRKIDSDSPLGKINSDISLFNSLGNMTNKYELLTKIFFKIQKKLAQSKTKADTRKSLDAWLAENKAPEKLKVLYQYDIYAKFKHSSADKNSLTDLEKHLRKIKADIEKLEQTDSLRHLHSVLTFLLADFQHATNSFQLFNNIINFIIDLKYHLLDNYLAKNDLTSDTFKTCENLYFDCDVSLAVLFRLFKNLHIDATVLNQVFKDKLDLSHDMAQLIHSFNSLTAERLLEGRYAEIPGPLSIKALGGGSNMVYRITHNLTNETVIVKLYPFDYDLYSTNFARLIDVRTRLGKAAPEFIGRIFLDKECFSVSKKTGVATLSFRIEVAEYFAVGDLENTSKECGNIKTKFKKQTLIDPVGAAVDDAIKITERLDTLHQLHIVCPDVKPTNFFLTLEGFIVIPDYKATFVYEDLHHVPFKELSISPHYLPLEVDGQETCDIISVNKYQLGLTLYERMTGDLEYKYHRKPKANPQDPEPLQPQFDHPIFQSEKGQAFLRIIQSLMGKPEDRPDLSVVAVELNLVKEMEVKKASHISLEERRNRSKTFQPTLFQNGKSQSDPVLTTTSLESSQPPMPKASSDKSLTTVGLRKKSNEGVGSVVLSRVKEIEMKNTSHISLEERRNRSQTVQPTLFQNGKSQSDPVLTTTGLESSQPQIPKASSDKSLTTLGLRKRSDEG